ncbi:MAG: hypothetical protein IPL96_17675 [Holophagaceae bacterium]|nr:hypothetical protein [Holophagaceae bacterium]
MDLSDGLAEGRPRLAEASAVTLRLSGSIQGVALAGPGGEGLLAAGEDYARCFGAACHRKCWNGPSACLASHRHHRGRGLPPSSTMMEVRSASRASTTSPHDRTRTPLRRGQAQLLGAAEGPPINAPRTHAEPVGWSFGLGLSVAFNPILGLPGPLW